MPSIKKKDHPIPEQFIALAEQAKVAGDKNNCTVIAVAIVAGLSYAEASVLLAKHGRKFGKGFAPEKYCEALESIGFEVVKIKTNFFLDQYSELHKSILKNVTTHHPDRFPHIWKDGKVYLLVQKTHVSAVVDGVVIDYTRGKRKQVVAIYEVKRKGQPVDLTVELQDALKALIAPRTGTKTNKAKQVAAARKQARELLDRIEGKKK